MFVKLSCKLKHRFTLQHLIHIKIVVFLNINLRIWYAECAISLHLILVILSVTGERSGMKMGNKSL